MASFDRQILDALAGDLDGKGTLFEECVCDLLRDDFPGLFPIRGGSDGGMDGGIPDGQGEAYPLICTTAQNVLRNLRGSLDSYLKNGGLRRKAVLATSQHLTPIKRKNLKKEARNKGFILTGTYDRRAMRDRLWHSPIWCSKLLDLPGRIPALSPVPRSNRPHPELQRIGRENDLRWLKETPGDLLLIGQPGSGKTYLLRQLVREDLALFLVDSDRDKIAGALREEAPKCIILDDAHLRLEDAEILRHLREQLRVEPQAKSFTIIATCWPDREDEVRDALGQLPKEQTHRLELMIRSELLDIIEQLGPHWPERLKKLIIEQSANKPGIAVTLSWLCLRGDWRDVIRGDALWSTLGPSFTRLVGRKAADFLAVLSLGGDGGMTSAVAREFLEWSKNEIRKTVFALDSGGVLHALTERRLAVEPAGLRPALIKQIFFQGPEPLDWRELLERVPNRDLAILEIVRAVHSGAEMADEELRNLVQQSAYPETWRGVAALKSHTLWALENNPAGMLHLIDEVFYHEPMIALEILIQAAEGDTRPLHSNPNHPLRRIQTWLEEPLQDIQAVLERRIMTIVVVTGNLKKNKYREVSTHAGCLALSPQLMGTAKSADDNQFIITSGLISTEGLSSLWCLWQKFLPEIGEISRDIWPHLRALIHHWMFLRSRHATEAYRNLTQDFALGMLIEIADISNDSQGLLLDIKRMTSRLGTDLNLDIDPIFEILFETETRPDLEKWRHREKRIRAIAEAWTTEKTPDQTVEILVEFAYQGQWLKKPMRDWIGLFCEFFAESTESANLWLESLLNRKVPANLLRPFVERVVTDQNEGWVELITRCLASPELAGPGVWAVAALVDPPKDLLIAALDNAASFAPQLSARCLRGELPVATASTLLSNPDPDLAITIAHSEWRAAPRDGFRKDLEEAGRSAILRSADPENIERWEHDPYLGDVLYGEPDLAMGWLERVLSQDRLVCPFAPDDHDVISKAISALNAQQRISLLQKTRSNPNLYGIVPRLVGDDPEVYRCLLAREELIEYRDYPLQGIPSEGWTQLAKVALEAGLNPREIAEATFLGLQTFWGSAAAHHAQWEQAFSDLVEHSDEGIRKIARHGLAVARAEVQEARKEEHQKALYGPRR